MCSIFGLFSKKEVEFPIEKIGESLLNESRDRGPDESSFISSGNRFFLGANRLSIIGKNGEGLMPMKDSHFDVWIALNGEIYNYVELRNELIANGVTFRTSTDTEVILKSYLYWKDTFIEKLNGIFSFCIYDARENRLICARDRFAAKPLYFYCDENTFSFGSDFLTVAKVAAEFSKLTLDSHAINSLINLRFVPGLKTIIKGVNKFAPVVRTIDHNKVMALLYKFMAVVGGT
jgi:asparagine synthase (glutamine-hydrolysing)